LRSGGNRVIESDERQSKLRPKTLSRRQTFLGKKIRKILTKQDMWYHFTSPNFDTATYHMRAEEWFLNRWFIVYSKSRTIASGIDLFWIVV
jgi:hypothetical protein